MDSGDGEGDPQKGASAFISYTRADDQSDGGRISRLAQDLRANYQMQTADLLDLFLDRDALTWGDVWAERISSAIAATRFFIPIITPSFFQSQQCRDELAKFNREAARVGLQGLILPIYWITVPELEAVDESSDELVHLVSERQYEDLRDARLEDLGSSAYGRALHDLASKLVARAAEVVVSAQSVTEPTPEIEPTSDDLGYLDRLAITEDAMAEFNDIIEQFRGELEALNPIIESAAESFTHAAQKQQGTRAALTVAARLGNDMTPVATRMEDLGRKYAEKLAELDPGVQSRLDMIDQGIVDRQDAKQELKSIVGLWHAADETVEQFKSMATNAQDVGALSQALKPPVKLINRGLQGIIDGQSVIEEWGRRADALLPEDSRGKDSQDNGRHDIASDAAEESSSEPD